MTATQSAPSPAKRAQQRIIDPVRSHLRRASQLSVMAGLIGPLLAALIAWSIGSWVSGAPVFLSVLAVALVFLALSALRGLLNYFAEGLLYQAAEQTITRERRLLIQREARSLSAVRSGEIAALMSQKLPLLQPWITRYYVAMARVRWLPLVILVLSFTMSWIVGLVLLVAGPLIPVFMALVGLAAEDASKKQMDEIGSLNDLTLERLSALLDIRALGATERMTKDFASRAQKLRHQTMQVLRIAFLSSAVLELFSALGVAMVAVFVGFTLLGELQFGTWGGGLSIEQGLFLLLIAPDFFQPMRDLAAAWHDRAAGFAVVKELDALDQADRQAFLGTAKPAAPLAGAVDIRVENAVVERAGQTIPLPDVHLTSGRSLAVIGPSGAGKTTLLSALLGLTPLAQGRIEINGAPLDDQNADAWRARAAFIPQRVHFANQPLRDWLTPRGSNVDLWDALEQAEIADAVKALPEGLDTRLGETGGGVSGGEARRLMVARAIMMDGDVLIADEPTADLDRETADRVIRALLQQVSRGATLIVSTHDTRLAAALDQQVGIAP
ncbi:ATP-binding cassette domain-containing protein [Epibacterium sp. SM1969]|uniref:ATP-binding cassette domain-containing protein n=2 Tax=Tritonibacter aquimaris TaxID=2663379 RepID=A0A844ALB6_9RHOB|nr:ATP-binding cassette domain-containing protein [Tritonibacter aquimaris]